MQLLLSNIITNTKNVIIWTSSSAQTVEALESVICNHTLWYISEYAFCL